MPARVTVAALRGPLFATLGERAMRTLLLFGVTIVLARTLEPAAYGEFAAAFAVYSILSAVVGLGTAGTLVRATVRSQDAGGLLRGTMLLRLGVAILLALTGLPLLACTLDFGVTLSAAIGLGLLAFSGEACDHHLQGREAFRALAVLRLAAAGLMSMATVASCLGGATVPGILALRLAEWLFFMLLAAACLRQLRLPPRAALRENLRAAVQLAHQSRPVLLATLAAVLYLKLDQLMLGWLATRAEIAHYAVAAQLSEAWYVLPVAIATVLLPTLTRLHVDDPAAYRALLQRWSDRLVGLAVGIAVIVSVAAAPLIEGLFGPGYAPAASVLQIHIWAAVFVFHRALVSKWLIVEGRLTLALYTQLAGLAVNVLLNLLLIPAYGGPGAAVATLLAYATAGYLGLRACAGGRAAAALFERSVLWPLRWLAPPGGRLP